MSECWVSSVLPLFRCVCWTIDDFFLCVILPCFLHLDSFCVRTLRVAECARLCTVRDQQCLIGVQEVRRRGEGVTGEICVAEGARVPEAGHRGK